MTKPLAISNKLKYQFDALLWKYPGKSAWSFVAIPMKFANEIKMNLRTEHEAFGRMKIIAEVGKCSWKTSIWFDTKHNTYLLPVKKEIRLKENLLDDKSYSFTIYL